MSESPVQPTEADARELAAKLNDFGAALPDGQKVLLNQLVADAKGDVQGFTTLAEYPLLLTILMMPLPISGPSTSPPPGSGTGATKGSHR